MKNRERITVADVEAALAEWADFWPLPPYLESKKSDARWMRKWAEQYTGYLNDYRPAVKYWDLARVRVGCTCRWFPMPVDVAEAAKQIWQEHTL